MPWETVGNLLPVPEATIDFTNDSLVTYFKPSDTGDVINLRMQFASIDNRFGFDVSLGGDSFEMLSVHVNREENYADVSIRIVDGSSVDRGFFTFIFPQPGDSFDETFTKDLNIIIT